MNIGKNLGWIYFVTSKSCNLNCKYCYVKKEKDYDPERDVKAIQGFKSFVDKLVAENVYVQKIGFHGAEPTLVSPNAYEEMINYYYSKFGREEKVTFGFQTNGILLKKFADKFDPKYVGFSISIDGYEENHDEFRGKGNFKRVMENLKYAVGKGFTPHILCVINKNMLKNFDKLHEFIKTITDLGCFITLKSVHVDENSGIEGDITLFNEEGYEFGRKIYAAGLSWILQMTRNDMCARFGNNCLWYEFDIDGNVYSCNKTFLADGTFANWSNESFDEIATKRVSLYHDRKLSNECYSCKYFMVCKGGCPSDRIKERSIDCFIYRGVLDACLEDGKPLTDVFCDQKTLRGKFHTEYNDSKTNILSNYA